MNKKHSPDKKTGQILNAVLLFMAVLAISIPALVWWTQHESRWTVQQQKLTTSFNLAEAGINRGVWKLKISTTTWAQAYAGLPIPGYNFDTVYRDIPGGEYRIKFSSGPGYLEITILAEGRDSSQKNVRAIKAIYKNQSIPGAIISGGALTWANAFEVHWGPVMTHGNINITDAVAAKKYYPRKFSRQVVSSVPSYPRDTNGMDPPNTDNMEWWSDYDVPDLPVIDFVTLRSSAAATGTLNVYGCKKSSTYTNPNPPYNTLSGNAPWDARSSCTGSNHTRHFGNPWNHPKSAKYGKPYVWYWDGDVELIGGSGSYGCGLWGTVVVRGNLTFSSGDNYSFTGPVPSEAWREYAKISKTVGDTSQTNQYPADDGYQKNRATFNFGNETWSNYPSDAGSYPPASNTDVGIRGFIYVGGDLNITSGGIMDINGAIWVVGDVDRAVGASDPCIIFFDESLQLPTLNVVLVKKSWQEVLPSSQPW